MPITFTPGIGRLATDRYSFKNHVEGSDFRHTADGISLNPSLTIDGYTADNVYSALVAANGELANLELSGKGFITIGDGYDTWHNANGSINFDPTIPSLDTLLIPAFTAITNGSGIPTLFQRVAKGGIILIKAGTYTIANTISVPPGIIIMGEGYGTKLVNITSLTIPGSGIAPSPKVSPTPAPLFKILADSNRSVNDAAIDPNLFMFGRSTQFINLVIADNFVENTILGDTNYKLPQNSSGNNPLIQQLAGSNLELHNVYMMGRVSFSSGTVVSAATRYAIQLDVADGINTGTILNLHNCFIDGFSVPIDWEATLGIKDYLEVSHCKIRSHGYLGGDGTTESANCTIHKGDCNARIVANEFFGNHALLKTVVYTESAAAVNIQDFTKVIISDNSFVIDRGANISITPNFIYIPADTADANRITILSNNVCDGENLAYTSKQIMGTSEFDLVGITDVIGNYVGGTKYLQAKSDGSFKHGASATSYSAGEYAQNSFTTTAGQYHRIILYGVDGFGNGVNLKDSANNEITLVNNTVYSIRIRSLGAWTNETHVIELTCKTQSNAITIINNTDQFHSGVTNGLTVSSTGLVLHITHTDADLGHATNPACALVEILEIPLQLV